MVKDSRKKRLFIMEIIIKRIDRSSPAREMGRRVYKGLSDPDTILSAKQVIEFFRRN